MTTKRVTPFTVGRGSVQPWEGSALVQVNAPFVPTLLHRLEVYKSRFAYESDADWGAGLDLVNRQQMELLMDIGDRLISEVRALRDGSATLPEERDPLIDPYTLTSMSLSRLHDIVNETGITTNGHLNNANNLLGEIKTILEAQSAGEGGQLEALQQIIFLLGAA